MVPTSTIATTLAVALLAGGTASASSSSHRCGSSTYFPPGAQEALTISNIRARGVTCKRARHVVDNFLRLGSSAGHPVVDGFRCHFGGSYPGRLTCGRRGARITGLGNGE